MKSNAMIAPKLETLEQPLSVVLAVHNRALSQKEPKKDEYHNAEYKSRNDERVTLLWKKVSERLDGLTDHGRRTGRPKTSTG